ncbi:MAG: hypothetical protein KL839_16730 [Rhizobium sp.]|nr:hypothetical protein [Rhizobium sp.]
MFASAPVVRDGNTVGIVDVGTGLANAYFTPLSDRIGGEIAVHILVDGKLMKAGLDIRKHISVARNTAGSLRGHAGPRAGHDRHRDHDRQGTVPFNNFSGTKIGVLEIASDVTAVVEDAQACALVYHRRKR